MKKVITYGNFDLLHYGHIRTLKQAKELGDYLIVAISTDEFNKKNKRNSYFNFKERKEVLLSLKYVDEVIKEEDWHQKENDIKKHDVDVFVMEDNFDGKYDYLKDIVDVVYIERTKGISAAKIRRDIIKQRPSIRNFLKRKKRNLKRRLMDLSKRNLFFRKIFRQGLFIKRRISYLKHYFKNKTDEKLIIFEAYMGRNYACSPKAIYLEMKDNPKYKDYKFVWAFKKPSYYRMHPDLNDIEIISYSSKNYYKVLSKAKYIITNSRIPGHVIFRDDQKYIQTWHGTPLKRLGHDIIENTKHAMRTHKELNKMNDLDAKRYSNMVSPSKFVSDVYKSAFNLRENNSENIIIEEGYPRNDFLYNFKQKHVNEMKEKLELPKDKKVILYAPTWRDNQHESGVGYTYKAEADFDYLQKHLKDDFVILFRAHYFVANSFDFDKYDGFITNASEVDDVNDLYIISDMLITDYSSVFFDYANLNRPILFFMYDLDYYASNLRGFYINLDELPGEIIKEEKELVYNIKNIDKYNKKYKSKYVKFNNKFNYLEDGKSTIRVVEDIFK